MTMWGHFTFASFAGTNSALSKSFHCIRNMSWPVLSLAPKIFSGCKPRAKPFTLFSSSSSSSESVFFDSFDGFSVFDLDFSTFEDFELLSAVLLDSSSSTFFRFCFFFWKTKSNVSCALANAIFLLRPSYWLDSLWNGSRKTAERSLSSQLKAKQDTHACVLVVFFVFFLLLLARLFKGLYQIRAYQILYRLPRIVSIWITNPFQKIFNLKESLLSIRVHWLGLRLGVQTTNMSTDGKSKSKQTDLSLPFPTIDYFLNDKFLLLSRARIRTRHFLCFAHLRKRKTIKANRQKWIKKIYNKIAFNGRFSKINRRQTFRWKIGARSFNGRSPEFQWTFAREGSTLLWDPPDFAFTHRVRFYFIFISLKYAPSRQKPIANNEKYNLSVAIGKILWSTLQTIISVGAFKDFLSVETPHFVFESFLIVWNWVSFFVEEFNPDAHLLVESFDRLRAKMKGID